MEVTVIKPLHGGRMVAYLTSTVRVRFPDSARGVAVYVTSDGWVGIRLDGETRVDQYPWDTVTPDT